MSKANKSMAKAKSKCKTCGVSALKRHQCFEPFNPPDAPTENQPVI
jgi:hypothetical protein